MLRIAFLSPSKASNITVRCCSTFAVTSKSPYPFKVVSSGLRNAVMSESSNSVMMYHRAASFSTALAEEDSSQRPPASTPKDTKAAARFDSFPMNEPIQRAISTVFKYEEMSIVQEKVTALMPTNNDMLVRAKTGTGKTLAFLIVALEKLRMNSAQDYREIESGQRGVSIVIMSPTRELAMQIADESRKLCSFLPFKTVLLVGGESKRDQLRKMQGRCDIIVATPVCLFVLIWFRVD
jgi:ATP-dependent RNA helicase MSS116